ncbi:tRNA (guanosine(46)-N7)-methyltransferase TrmB [Mycoplasma enhydrae]|uniref:tRNA (guanosine(46)-N7)-methyltransferase TrmB n=1 Tax=Mycoplasma enhydrae TaxID=2499220 RepID=UPI0021E80D82|nr:tRNA (guanosine(46)-N7)-methyltransferase TrmB [Mycoplasma enhydrae]MCV3733737.1 tRNA (guanosine(46)-N7)-methyltransferase TrmB [Mycoplasma enhydrae]
MRLRHNKNALDILKKSEFFINDFPYKVSKNTILEIGMGKGKMLSEMAQSHPKNNYIGIEKYSTPALLALKKINEKEISNMKIIVADAINLESIFDGKIKTIWLTFSDPWPKKRHYKRRLVYRDFLKQYQKILSTDGLVYFKSDNQILYDFALEEIQNFGAEILFHTNDFHNSNYLDENFFTDYELKFKNEGKNIYFIAFKF